MFSSFLVSPMKVSQLAADSKDSAPDLYRECTLACLIPKYFKVEDLLPSTSSSAAPKAKPECHDYKSGVRAEELRTHIDTTVILHLVLIRMWSISFFTRSVFEY